MKCSKCKINPINNYSICPKCNIYFCSRNCLINHTLSLQNHKPLVKFSSLDAKQNNPNFHLTNGPYAFIDFEPKKLTKDEFSKFKNTGTTLGLGSYGEVYLMECSLNDSKNSLFAMKQFKKVTLKYKDIPLDQLKLEIKIHSKIYHPNIIQFHSYYEDQNYINIILEYAPRGNLFQLIQAKGINTELEIFKVFYQVISAISFLHENNILHRDIKPENILLYDDLIVKLSDFGCSCQTTVSSRRSYCGTFEYIAPEVIKENKVYGKPADIWSLGILLYELYHGYTIYKTKNKTNKDNVMANIITGQINFEAKKMCSEAKELIKKILVYNPNKRINMKDIFHSNYVLKFINKLNSPLVVFSGLSKNIRNNTRQSLKEKGYSVNHSKILKQRNSVTNEDTSTKTKDTSGQSNNLPIRCTSGRKTPFQFSSPCHYKETSSKQNKKVYSYISKNTKKNTHQSPKQSEIQDIVVIENNTSQYRKHALSPTNQRKLNLQIDKKRPKIITEKQTRIGTPIYKQIDKKENINLNSYHILYSNQNSHRMKTANNGNHKSKIINPVSIHKNYNEKVSSHRNFTPSMKNKRNLSVDTKNLINMVGNKKKDNNNNSHHKGVTKKVIANL